MFRSVLEIERPYPPPRPSTRPVRRDQPSNMQTLTHPAIVAGRWRMVVGWCVSVGVCHWSTFA
jgi:hypothetical protein